MMPWLRLRRRAPGPSTRLPCSLEHGHRAGGARAAVIEALGRHGGCLDADELVARLRRQRKRVGVASVYRALGLLAELGLLQRVPVAGGSARYELVGPGGDHHHHLVCDDCGATTRVRGRGARTRHRAPQPPHRVRRAGPRRDAARNLPGLPALVAGLEQCAADGAGPAHRADRGGDRRRRGGVPPALRRRRRRGHDLDDDADAADGDPGRRAHRHRSGAEAAALEFETRSASSVASPRAV